MAYPPLDMITMCAECLLVGFFLAYFWCPCSASRNKIDGVHRETETEKSDDDAELTEVITVIAGGNDKGSSTEQHQQDSKQADAKQGTEKTG